MRKNRHRNRNSANTAGTTTASTTSTAVVKTTNTPGYNKVVTVPKRTEVTTKFKPKVILTDKFLRKVSYLHKNVEKNTEWSAILLYTNSQGTIDNADSWVMTVQDCILMDVGTSSYTEYDMESGDDYATEKWQDHLLDGGKIGHLHTHHNMACFFSGTDMGELHDNAPNHNYYLSLIVNYRDINAWCAKVAVCGEEKTSGTLETTKTWIGAKGPMTKTESESMEDTQRMLYLMDCDLVPESDTHVPEGLQQRLESIVEKKKKAKAAAPAAKQIWNSTTRKWCDILPKDTNTGTGKGNVNYSAGVMNMGNGNTRTFPYTGTGTKSTDDEFEESLWEGLFDVNGNAIRPIEAHSESKPKGTVVERYSPKVCGPILVQILEQDLKSKETIQTCLMGLEGATDSVLDPHMDECAGNFRKTLKLHFPETLTPIHLHAIVVSMYYVLEPYNIFSAYEAVDSMLVEYLLEDGEFNPIAIKQMTGVDIEDQFCLDKTEEEEEVKPEPSNVD